MGLHRLCNLKVPLKAALPIAYCLFFFGSTYSSSQGVVPSFSRLNIYSSVLRIMICWIAFLRSCPGFSRKVWVFTGCIVVFYPQEVIAAKAKYQKGYASGLIIMSKDSPLVKLLLQ